jgi:hypothetical protein
MFIALENVGRENGPTEFLIGSHLSCDDSTRVDAAVR